MTKRIYEGDGTRKGVPVNGWDCPHWSKGNICCKKDALLCLDFKLIFGSWEYWEQL